MIANKDPQIERTSNLSNRLNQSAAALAGWSFDHRWWVVFFALALVAGSLALASSARIDSSYEAYFDPDDPAYLAYETFRADFGSDEVSYILYEAPETEFGPWNYRVMEKIVELKETVDEFFEQIMVMTKEDKLRIQSPSRYCPYIISIFVYISKNK